MFSRFFLLNKTIVSYFQMREWKFLFSFCFETRKICRNCNPFCVRFYCFLLLVWNFYAFNKNDVILCVRVLFILFVCKSLFSLLSPDKKSIYVCVRFQQFRFGWFFFSTEMTIHCMDVWYMYKLSCPFNFFFSFWFDPIKFMDL